MRLWVFVCISVSVSVCLCFRVFCDDIVEVVIFGETWDFLDFLIIGVSVSGSGEGFLSWVCVVLFLFVSIGEKEMWLFGKSSKLVG